MERPINLSFII